jgi:hypothetical protein
MVMLRKHAYYVLALLLTAGMVSACSTPTQQKAQAIVVNNTAAICKGKFPGATTCEV